MKLIALSLACVALALVAFACTQTAAPTNSPAPVGAASPTKPTDELAAGRVTYQTNCEQCHGPNGDGGPAKVDGKDIKVPSLRSARIAKRTDERITKVINEGDGPMPPFKNKIKPDEIAALLRFVRKEFHSK